MGVGVEQVSRAFIPKLYKARDLEDRRFYSLIELDEKPIFQGGIRKVSTNCLCKGGGGGFGSYAFATVAPGTKKPKRLRGKPT